MNKFICFLLSMITLQQLSLAQGKDKPQRSTLAVSYIYTDFKSAAAVRANNIGNVMKNGEFGKFRNMAPGLTVSYIKGLTKYHDIVTSLTGSFVDYPIPNRAAFGRDFLLLEGDVSARGKIISNNAAVSPYLQAGVGFSKYKGYFGSYIPVGMGLQVNLFQEAYILLNAQYRIPVSELVNYHFYYGIGFAGHLGKK
jgi:hypothetical protein